MYSPSRLVSLRVSKPVLKISHGVPRIETTRGSTNGSLSFVSLIHTDFFIPYRTCPSYPPRDPGELILAAVAAESSKEKLHHKVEAVCDTLERGADWSPRVSAWFVP